MADYIAHETQAIMRYIFNQSKPLAGDYFSKTTDNYINNLFQRKETPLYSQTNLYK